MATRLQSQKVTIFICYRHEDQDITELLYRELTNTLKGANIAIDVRSMHVATPLDKAIVTTISSARLVVVIIGPRWLDILNEKKLSPEDKDWVRFEIATALAREIPVFPLCVHGARIPSASQLPDDLKQLPDQIGLAIHGSASLESSLTQAVAALRRKLLDLGWIEPAPLAPDVAPGPAPAHPANSVPSRWRAVLVPVLLGLLLGLIFYRFLAAGSAGRSMSLAKPPPSEAPSPGGTSRSERSSGLGGTTTETGPSVILARDSSSRDREEGVRVGVVPTQAEVPAADDSVRQGSEAARAGAEDARTRALTEDSHRFAKSTWERASKAEDAALTAFGAGDFAGASNEWGRAAAAYRAAMAEAITEKGRADAERRWNESLQRVDRSLLDEFGGQDWLEAKAQAKVAESQTRAPEQAKASYEAAGVAITKAWAVAEEASKPRLLLMASTDGHAIVASVKCANGDYKTPATIDLQYGRSYACTVSYEADGEKWVPQTLSGDTDWRGTRTNVVDLKKVSEFVPPSSLSLDLGGGQRLEMVWIPPGEFFMGSPPEESGRGDERQHRVRITKGFWMSRYEVTQGIWRQVSGDASHSTEGGSNAPVTKVSWPSCQSFLGRLTALQSKARPDLRLRFRFPTEAEWEYACRAGSTAAHAGDLEDLAWVGEEADRGPHEVGTKAPNAWGIHDMHGNVAEWCADWYGAYPITDVSDPQGAETSPYRIVRGGSWKERVSDARSAKRGKVSADIRDENIGMRVVAQADEAP